MRRVLFDSDVLLDVLAQRQPFVDLYVSNPEQIIALLDLVKFTPISPISNGGQIAITLLPFDYSNSEEFGDKLSNV